MLTIAMMHKPDRPMHPALSKKILSDWYVDLHTEGSLWECARDAWLSGVRDKGHHLVIHDDIRPCIGFMCQVNQVLKVLPQAVISLWGSRSEVIVPKPGAFYKYNTFSWGGALILPCAWIEPFIEFCNRNIDPAWPCDDTRLTLWCCETDRSIYVPVPNLIQHGELESTHQSLGAELKSYTYEENPGVVPWRAETVDIPGDRASFIVSRRMHYVNP